MKKSLPILLFIVLCFLCRQAYADHVMGTDIQWKSLGNDTFKIIFRFYRDCRGIPRSGSVVLSFASDSCSSAYTGTVTCTRTSIKDITPVCLNNRPCNPTNTMVTGIPYGIEEHIFEGKVYLGGNYANCCWYKFIFSDCCRSGVINTGYSWANYSTELMLNRCVTPQDNSPEFRNPPLGIACTGQDIYYSDDVNDIDGDSLVFKKALPNGGTYSSPWSTNYPLTCYGGAAASPNPNSIPVVGYNLNTRNGEIAFRPLAPQETVIKMQVEEWRKINGVFKLIGVTARDMQFILLNNCGNKFPLLSGPYAYDVCLGSQICITINSRDSNLTDSTKIYWNGGIKNGSWTSNNDSVKNATGTMCWTPDTIAIKNIPYYFTAGAIDNYCPLQGKIVRTYSVTVRTLPESIRTYSKIDCRLIEFKAIPKNTGMHGASYIWYEPMRLGTGLPANVVSNNATFQFQFSQAGVYIIKSAIVLGCSNTYFDTLVVDSNQMHITTASDTIICPGAQAILVSDSLSSYQWYNDTIPIPGARSRNYIATQAGKYTVRYSTTCSYNSNIIIIGVVGTLKIIKQPVACSGDTVKYVVTGSATAIYQWYRNGSPVNGATGNNLNVVQDGIYYCRVIQPGCIVQSISDTVVFLPFPENTRTYTKLSCWLIEFKATPKSIVYNASTYNWYLPELVGMGMP